MKKSILLLATVAALPLCFPVTANAATQVYDLKTDWSDTQNPNGAWSYRQGNNLLMNVPLPWVGVGYDGSGTFAATALEKVGADVHVYGGTIFVYEELQTGDVLFVPGGGGNILWTAPANGTIDIAGVTWWVSRGLRGQGVVTSWTLSHNGSGFSGGDVPAADFDTINTRETPHDFATGSGGAAALQNISVTAGDQIVLAFSTGEPVGVNLTITLTPNSFDPVSAIEDLALTVVAMNLQNGIENSLDSKLDAALDALVDANFNNDGAACNSLAAFINAVEAQRGKKITNAQANQLIASAREIRTMLNCGN
jgi:hypothetical protein